MSVHVCCNVLDERDAQRDRQMVDLEARVLVGHLAVDVEPWHVHAQIEPVIVAVLLTQARGQVWTPRGWSACANAPN
ncbi:MAG TPA: hypothetical protein VIK33_04670 [Anaerolineae bacterium]